MIFFVVTMTLGCTDRLGPVDEYCYHNDFADPDVPCRTHVEEGLPPPTLRSGRWEVFPGYSGFSGSSWVYSREGDLVMVEYWTDTCASGLLGACDLTTHYGRRIDWDPPDCTLVDDAGQWSELLPRCSEE